MATISPSSFTNPHITVVTVAAAAAGLPHRSSARVYLKPCGAGSRLISADPSNYKHIQELAAIFARNKHLFAPFQFEVLEDSPEIRFPISGRDVQILVRTCPDLQPYFQDSFGNSCFFSEDSPIVSMRGLMEPAEPKFSLARSLSESAEKSFAELASTLTPVECTIGPILSMEDFAQDREILRHVYANFDGLCIGEYHGDITPIKFLLDNLDEIQRLGIRTLFVEHLQYEMQPLLDAYFDTPLEAPMPLFLQEKLSVTHQRFPYSYINLLKKAKTLGIRIVGIDTGLCYAMDASTLQGADRRLIMMNYEAVKIIVHEKGSDKYVALMGAAHAFTLHRGPHAIPGIASLLGCPGMIAKDSLFSKLSFLRRNVTDLEDLTGAKYGLIHLHITRPRPL